jgi:hypothetical protein
VPRNLPLPRKLWGLQYPECGCRISADISVSGTAYQEAIENLPAGGILVLEDVPWEEYEHLLDDIGNRQPGLRITYDQGRLQVMRRLFEHEQHKEFILQLVRVPLSGRKRSLRRTAHRDR